MPELPVVPKYGERGLPLACVFACSSPAGGIFRDLPPSTLAELDLLRQSIAYPACAAVYPLAGYPRAVYFVCSGSVKLTRRSPFGRAVILRVARCGDVLGLRELLLGVPYEHTAETLEETRLCFVAGDSFLAFLRRNGDVSLRLAERLSAELDGIYRQVSNLMFRPAVERLADHLQNLCHTQGDPTPEGVRVGINLRQDDLAELLGLSRRSLNRAMSMLKEQGLIECRRRFIIVRDPALLAPDLLP